MPTEEETLAANKAVVARFNKEVIEQGNETTFRELMAPDFVNRSAPPGAPTGPCSVKFADHQSTERDRAATRRAAAGGRLTPQVDGPQAPRRLDGNEVRAAAARAHLDAQVLRPATD
jgi:hypothetical protein